jgi:hypothetical protein
MISPTPLTQIVIRLSAKADEGALGRLAGRDSRAVPEGAVLVAESDGEIRAALSLDGKGAVADPFHRTADLTRLLEVRRRQLRVEPSQQGSAPRAARRPRTRRARLVPAFGGAFVGRLPRR